MQYVDLTAAAAVTLAPHAGPGLGLSHNLLPRAAPGPHRFGSIVLIAANALLAVTVFAAACAWAS